MTTKLMPVLAKLSPSSRAAIADVCNHWLDLDSQLQLQLGEDELEDIISQQQAIAEQLRSLSVSNFGTMPPLPDDVGTECGG